MPLMTCSNCSFVFFGEGMPPAHRAGTSTFQCKGSAAPGVEIDKWLDVEIVDAFGNTCWEGSMQTVPQPGWIVEYDHDGDGVCNLDGVVRGITYNANTGHITVCLE